jgi:hypothetical protein
VANASKNKKLHFAEGLEILVEKTRHDAANFARVLVDESTFDQIESILIVGDEGIFLGIAAEAIMLEILIFVTNHR